MHDKIEFWVVDQEPEPELELNELEQPLNFEETMQVQFWILVT